MSHYHPPTVPNPQLPNPHRWQSALRRKPWSYQITAAIPCLNHPRETSLVVQLLRLQTERPYIILVDTGSTPRDTAALHNLTATDCELHSIRRNAMQHPCDSIGTALDLAFSLADTPFVYTTHQDCFLRSPTFLHRLLQMIDGLTAVGYQLTPRLYAGWQHQLGHTATLWRLADYDNFGLSWSLRRAARLLGHGRPHGPQPDADKIDTEACMNELIRHNNLRILLCGAEQNFARTLDQNIDHCRSLVCSSLYSPPHYALARRWIADATTQARRRIREWSRLFSFPRPLSSPPK